MNTKIIGNIMTDKDAKRYEPLIKSRFPGAVVRPALNPYYGFLGVHILGIKKDQANEWGDFKWNELGKLEEENGFGDVVALASFVDPDKPYPPEMTSPITPMTILDALEAGIDAKHKHIEALGHEEALLRGRRADYLAETMVETGDDFLVTLGKIITLHRTHIIDGKELSAEERGAWKRRIAYELAEWSGRCGGKFRDAVKDKNNAYLYDQYLKVCEDGNARDIHDLIFGNTHYDNCDNWRYWRRS